MNPQAMRLEDQMRVQLHALLRAALQLAASTTLLRAAGRLPPADISALYIEVCERLLARVSELTSVPPSAEVLDQLLAEGWANRIGTHACAGLGAMA